MLSLTSFSLETSYYYIIEFGSTSRLTGAENTSYYYIIEFGSTSRLTGANKDFHKIVLVFTIRSQCD